MEYITAREAAEKWSITVRQVQSLCDNGRIPGAVRFNRCWAIPKDIAKPADGRKKAPAAEGGEHWPLKPFHEKEYTLSRFVTFLPYPIQIMAPDGVLIMVNDAWQSMFRFSDVAVAKLIGNYNILTHPAIEKWGMKDDVLRLFRGEPVQWKDVKAPLQEISDVLGDKELTTETIYQNIISFPVFNDAHQIIFVVIIYITSRLYSGKEEIVNGREYIENHWRERFDLGAAAKASGLSKGHFEKLFKIYTGFSPHSYHLDLRNRMLQKKLKDSNISIAQAFEECGVEYNSHYVRLFKEWTGMTPMEYRKNG